MAFTQKYIPCDTKDFSVFMGLKAILLGFSILSVALVVAFAISSLYVSSDSFADTDVKASTKINATLSVSVSGDIATEITPTSAGAFVSGSSAIMVDTNNQTGYTLSFSSKSNETSLIHSSSTVTDKITSITSALTLVNIASNTWGYALGDISNSTVFAPIPAVSAPVNVTETDKPSNDSDRSTKFNIGVKADTSIASGRYSNTLIFFAVANDTPVFDGISTMQEMTAAICKSEPTPAAFLNDGITINPSVPSATLIDTRDGKSYTVAKLADDKCWMTQDLALGGDTPIELTSADSDVAGNAILMLLVLNGHRAIQILFFG